LDEERGRVGVGKEKCGRGEKKKISNAPEAVICLLWGEKTFSPLRIKIGPNATGGGTRRVAARER